MERRGVKRIVFIGSGNVATHLALALDKVTDVVQVYSRHLSSANELAVRMRACQAIDNPLQVTTDADIYIVSASDDAVAKIIDDISVSNGLWLHTSGSVPMSVFEGKRSDYGVLYPLQTFSKAVAVNVSRVPFFVEGSGDAVTAEITELAHLLSSKVSAADSRQRKMLHVAAVFACNFANHLWAVADEVLADAGYSFDVLVPLIEATLAKAAEISPLQGQTGPARRGDNDIITSHCAMLSQGRATLYKMLSQSIINQYKAEKDE